MPDPNEAGLALGGLLIASLVGLLVASFAVGGASPNMGPGAGTVLLGLYILAWGMMFLASYYFSHKSFFLRGLLWVCENWSRPAGRKMAFFYFVLASVLGGASIIRGLGLL
jgi:hypothetical protein